jgi:hypothetical protein
VSLLDNPKVDFQQYESLKNSQSRSLDQGGKVIELGFRGAIILV